MNVILRTYTLWLKHNSGETKLYVKAECLESAIKMVMLSENCPRRAIVKAALGRFHVSLT